MVTSITVLLVEDEALIQEMAGDALEEAGFTVARASTGKQALTLLEAEDAGYRALISDVNLGRGPTGWDVARRAREINARLPVVYTTGGNADEWTSKGVPNSVLVLKPFAPAQIVTAVSQLLNITEH